jgi:hypothetical protein
LLTKLRHAIEELDEHYSAFIQLENALDPKDTDIWKQEVEAWEAKRSDQNPYTPRVKRELYVAFWFTYVVF